MKVLVMSLLGKVGEEERGVADDASSPRLLMLTALQDKPIVHVALSMQAGLDQDTHKYAFRHYNRQHNHIYKAMKQPGISKCLFVQWICTLSKIWLPIDG